MVVCNSIGREPFRDINRYPKALKDAVLKKLIELERADHVPTGTFTEIAHEAGIATTTVYQWNADLKRKQRLAARGSRSGVDAWAGAAKFQAVCHPKQRGSLNLGSI